MVPKYPDALFVDSACIGVSDATARGPPEVIVTALALLPFLLSPGDYPPLPPSKERAVGDGGDTVVGCPYRGYTLRYILVTRGVVGRAKVWADLQPDRACVCRAKRRDSESHTPK